MAEQQLDNQGKNAIIRYLTVNLIWIVILVILSISSVLSTWRFGFAVLSILTRGIMGIGVIINGIYWMVSKNWPFRDKNLTTGKKQFGGILLIVVGLIGVITALMGYGFNGNPRFLWWEYL